jgi:hypothetical protein
MIEHLRKLARNDARGNKTGWARRGDVFVAYYPRSDRYAYFLKDYGVINRRDLELYLARAA